MLLALPLKLKIMKIKYLKIVFLFLLMFSFLSNSFAIESDYDTSATLENNENISVTKGRFIYVSSEGEIIYNGQSLGYGENPVVDGSDYAYETIKSDGVHVVFNGRDMGLGVRPQITEGSILFETESELKNSIVFNHKNYGEGYEPIVENGHFIYFKKVNSENLRSSVQGSVLVYYDGEYYCDGDASKIKDKVKMSGDNVICEQEMVSNSETKSFIILNGEIINEGYNINVSESHYAYNKKKDFGDGQEIEIIVLDGKELGTGKDLEFSDDSFIYFKENLSGKEEIIFNGRNLGEFKSRDTIFFEDGHVAFLRDKEINERQSDGTYEKKTYIHVIYDGVDRGAGDITTNDETTDSKKIFLSGNNIAFERKRKTIEYSTSESDKNLALDKRGRELAEKTEVDVSYVVFDGRERTQIIEGTLRMKDGYFAFAKEVEVKEQDEDYASERYKYYKDNKYGANPEKDLEFKSLIKYLWVKKPYMFKGFPDGSIKKMGTGLAETLIVEDKKVAYIREKEEEIYYNAEGENRERLQSIRYVMIDGSKKGQGDILDLVMDKGQYSFTENVDGRFFLVINGVRQDFPGNKVLFLDPDPNESKNSNIKEEISLDDSLTGLLLTKQGKYFIKTSSSILRLVPEKNIYLEKYDKKRVIINGELKAFITKNSRRKIYAYKVFSVALVGKTSISNTNVIEGKAKELRGVLERNGNSLYLYSEGRRYNLRMTSQVKREDIEPYVGDTIKMSLNRKNQYWEIQSFEL